jgi:UDP-GlcNAc3NAcA epimerase
MPEEQNRILTDHISNLLFVPTQTAIDNLVREGITKGVHNVGDVMFDGILHFSKIAAEKSAILAQLGVSENEYLLCTIHRAENTNDISRLKGIVKGLNDSKEPIILPLHPRTQKYLNDYEIALGENIRVIEPVGYLDMVRLETGAKKIVTDSGGVQKEAFFLGKPCITMRDETEWVETVENGWNVIVGANAEKITHAINSFEPTEERKNYFGNGTAARQMADLIL